MGDVVILPTIRAERERESNVGKDCIPGRRMARDLAEPLTVDDLVLDHADLADTAPCELCGQTGDCA